MNQENLSQLNITDPSFNQISNDRFTKMLDVIASHATKNEIATFARRRKSIEKFIDSKINPLENEILDINAKLEPLYDELKALREDMVDICVHPRDLLILKDGYIECKFCGAKLGVPNV